MTHDSNDRTERRALPEEQASRYAAPAAAPDDAPDAAPRADAATPPAAQAAAAVGPAPAADAAISDATSTAVPPPAVGPAPGAAQKAADSMNEALSSVLRWASRADVRRTRAGDGLSPTDTWLLGAIELQGPIRLSDLAAWQGVDKSTMTPQVRRIEDRGLIRREPDPTDRRASLLFITDRGRDIRRQLARDGAVLVEAVLARWTPEERDTLAALFTRFADDLETRRSAVLGGRR